MAKILRFSGWLLALILIGFVVGIALIGGPHLTLDFFTSYPSRIPNAAGIRSAILGSLWVMTFTAIFTIPLGVSTAIFLAEFAPKNKFYRFLCINIANLAGVPSIIYGILGLSIFVRGLDLGRSILAASLTLTLMALPLVILASLEALQAVPRHLIKSARAMGATHWQTTRDHLIPAALPGLLTGIILSLSRVAGETAPLILMGAFVFVAFDPKSIHDSFTVLPIQIYNWASRPQAAFQEIAAAAILALLAGLFALNGIALFIRKKYASRNLGSN